MDSYFIIKQLQNNSLNEIQINIGKPDVVFRKVSHSLLNKVSYNVKCLYIFSAILRAKIKLFN